MDAFEQKVRERAYEIWVAAGMCDGQELEHWFAAEKAVTPALATKAPRAKKASAKIAKAPSSKAVAAKAPAKAASRKTTQPVAATLN